MLIYLFYFGIHSWTNAFTGRKKVIGQIYFPCYIFFCDCFAILVCKGEGLYETDRRKFGLAKTRNYADQYNIKSNYKKAKKCDIKYCFTAHKRFDLQM